MNPDRGRGASPAGAFCAVGDTALVRDVLYFGRNTPGGTELGGSAWQQFVDEVVTPRIEEAVLRERVMTCSRF